MSTSMSERRHLVKAAMKAPYLTREEELELAIQWRDNKDEKALEKLSLSHMRLVIAVASRFKNFGLNLGDLIQEGHVGLLEAAARFEPEREVRFSTYATWWIRASIQEYILRSWSLVKMGTTAAQKKLFFNLRKAKSKIDALEDGDLHPDQVQAIATKLGVPEQDVINMNRRMSNGGDQSLNAPLRADADGGEWQDWLVDESETAEDVVSENEELTRRREMLHTAMETLNEREMHILTERRLKDEPSTLEELSQEYGISRERVRQIEVRAFEKLQKAMRAAHKDEIRATREKAEEYAN